MIKSVREIERKPQGLTNAGEVAEEQMLAEEKRRVLREKKKQQILHQNLEMLCETSRRKDAMDEAEFEQGLRAQLERPKPPDPKALPPTPVEPAKLALPEASTASPPDAPAAPQTEAPQMEAPQTEAPQTTVAPAPPAAEAATYGDTTNPSGVPEIA